MIESRGLLLSAWLILSAALPTDEITEIMRLMCDQAGVIVWPKCWWKKRRPDHFGYDSALYVELVNIHPILSNEV